MRVTGLLTSALALTALIACEREAPAPTGPARILVFSKTAGYRHESIDSGKVALMRLGAANGMLVDTTEDAARFTEDSLKQYAAVVFLSTTENVLTRAQEIDLQRFIQAGGGYVGIHAAADTEYDWGWYGRLVGAYFKSHPEQQEATLRITDAQDASTAHLPAEWKRRDEWYNYKSFAPDLHILISLDESSYRGGENDGRHPISWRHEYDGGRPAHA